MDLYTPQHSIDNILPIDGEACYLGPIMAAAEADRMFDCLFQTIQWQHDEIMMFGRKIVTKRQVAWYADPGRDYRYSGVTKQALPWTPELLQLKQLVESASAETFNSCLLNLYHDGSEGMGWHSDDEKELKPDGTIASVSLGVSRRFVFKHREKSMVKPEIVLEHGSLLLMMGQTQRFWLHRLPPSTKITKPRINLTFRTIIA